MTIIELIDKMRVLPLAARIVILIAVVAIIAALLFLIGCYSTGHADWDIEAGRGMKGDAYVDSGLSNDGEDVYGKEVSSFVHGLGGWEERWISSF